MMKHTLGKLERLKSRKLIGRLYAEGNSVKAKRLLRETYRKEKQLVYNSIDKPYVFMISYIGREEHPYDELLIKMNKLLNLFILEAKKKKDEKL